MKTYSNPDFEFVKFEITNVVTTSGDVVVTPTPGGNGTGIRPVT